MIIGVGNDQFTWMYGMEFGVPRAQARRHSCTTVYPRKQIRCDLALLLDSENGEPMLEYAVSGRPLENIE